MDDDSVKPASAPDRSGGQEPPGSAAPEDRLIDHGQLSAIARGSGVTEPELASDFRRVNDRDVAMLRGAAAQRDFPRIAHFSHRIRGASMMFGAARLGRACRVLEAASRQSDIEETQNALDVFEAEILRLNDYLDALSGAGTPAAGGVVAASHAAGGQANREKSADEGVP